MKTHPNVTSHEIRMHTYTASSRSVKRSTAAVMISLVAAGAAGVSIGGPLWGFLGATLLLFCVGWICHLLQYDHGTDEIERYYHPQVAVPAPVHMTTRAAVLQRTRSFVLTPLHQMESTTQ